MTVIMLKQKVIQHIYHLTKPQFCIIQVYNIDRLYSVQMCESMYICLSCCSLLVYITFHSLNIQVYVSTTIVISM